MSTQLYRGDCFDILPTLPVESVDLVLADIPYGTTKCKWDTVLDLERMWVELGRVCVKNAAMVFTASQPFTSTLVMSNPKMFKHEWIWAKGGGSNFLNTSREPLKQHESVLVFSIGKWTYNRQMQERGGKAKKLIGKLIHYKHGGGETVGKVSGISKVIPELRVPSSIQKFGREVGHHPTQKPVTLMEYLIKTYSNEGDTVLDFTMGSGTTGVAAQNLNRSFIGIEKELEHFYSAKLRIDPDSLTLFDKK